MLFNKEIDYNVILVIKKLFSLFYIYFSLICYFLVLKKLFFKYNNVLLVFLINICFIILYL